MDNDTERYKSNCWSCGAGDEWNELVGSKKYQCCVRNNAEKEGITESNREQQ